MSAKSTDFGQEPAHHVHFHPERFPLVDYDKLQMLKEEHCSCCNGKFTAESPPLLGAACHSTGNVEVHYWEGFIYIQCAVCQMPIVKIEVKQ